MVGDIAPTSDVIATGTEGFWGRCLAAVNWLEILSWSSLLRNSTALPVPIPRRSPATAIFMSAPRSINSIATSWCPNHAAALKAVHPILPDSKFTPAPLSSRSFTISTRPAELAAFRAVPPCKAFFSLTSAPLSRSYFTVFISLREAAIDNGD